MSTRRSAAKRRLAALEANGRSKRRADWSELKLAPDEWERAAMATQHMLIQETGSGFAGPLRSTKLAGDLFRLKGDPAAQAVAIARAVELVSA